jgi:hypothetical protein
VSLRLRQRFLRQAAADLATSTYDDERAAELRAVVRVLAKLDAYLNRPDPCESASAGKAGVTSEPRPQSG